MKRPTHVFLLLLSFCLITQKSFADTQDSLAELYHRTNAIADSVRMVNDSLAKLKIAAAIDAYYDSSAVAKAKANPLGIIYKDEWKWNGKTWQIHPFVMSLLILVLVIISFYAVLKTNMLRDIGTDSGGKALPTLERPYSYSRVQLYWWTMIILISFVLLFLKTWYLLPLNVTTIVLLGLGAVVHIGGRMIDQKDLNDDDVELGTRKQDERAGKRSFFKDLLTDGSGVSVHRFQTLVFNIVFGVGFVSFFAMSLAARQYPFIDFSEWQLALLGVSSATYLGVKATENNASGKQSKRQQAIVTQNDSKNVATNTAGETEEPTVRNPADFEQ